MDLNICIEISGVRDPDDIIREKVNKCCQLGFNIIALSVMVDPDQKIPPPPDTQSFSQTSKLKIYTRLTVRVKRTDSLYKLNKDQIASQYDLLALEPQNFDILQYITRGNANLDIITFDLTDRLDFNMFKTKFKTLADKGVCIELNYGPAQMGSAMRRNVICNGQNLIEKAGKNVILSNGVQDIFRLRGPMDAKSVGVLFLIPPKRCHDTVYKNGKIAIDSAKHRKKPITSVIEKIDPSEQTHGS